MGEDRVEVRKQLLKVRDWEWRCQPVSKHPAANTSEKIMASYSFPSSNSLESFFHWWALTQNHTKKGILENVDPSLRRKWQWCQRDESELTQDITKVLHLIALDRIPEIKLLLFTDKTSYLVSCLFFTSTLSAALTCTISGQRGRNNVIGCFKRLT